MTEVISCSNFCFSNWFQRERERGEGMAAYAHCWMTCYASTTHRLLQPSHLRVRGRRTGARCGGLIVGSLEVGVQGIGEIVHNRVLIAAAGSAAIGQLSKPFTSALLYGKGVDLRDAVRPGGFPSTHSSAVVAAATSLAFERGFSDSIFGLAVVYAALVMYDAQGVRLEVGKHAVVMNRVLLNNTNSSNINYSTSKSTTALSSSPSKQDEAMVASHNSKPSLAPTLPRQDGLDKDEAQGEAVSKGVVMTAPLKETVGHTKVEVVAGAFLGLLTGLVICASDIV